MFKMSSPNTTITGVAMMLGALATAAVAIFDGDPETVVNWTVTIAALVAGWGLFKSRDNATSSEDVPVIVAKRAEVPIS